MVSRRRDSKGIALQFSRFIKFIFAIRYFRGSNRNLISRFWSQSTKFAHFSFRENFVIRQNKFKEENHEDHEKYAL